MGKPFWRKFVHKAPIYIGAIFGFWVTVLVAASSVWPKAKAEAEAEWAWAMSHTPIVFMALVIAALIWLLLAMLLREQGERHKLVEVRTPLPTQRTLDERQRQRIVAEAAQHVPPDVFSIIYNGDESLRFAMQISETLNLAGWKTDIDTLLQTRTATGLTLASPTGAAPPPFMDALARGLSDAGVKYHRMLADYPHSRLFVDLMEVE